jgi:hypothetical protein
MCRVRYLWYPTPWFQLLSPIHLDYRATLFRPIARSWHRHKAIQLLLDSKRGLEHQLTLVG